MVSREYIAWMIGKLKSDRDVSEEATGTVSIIFGEARVFSK